MLDLASGSDEKEAREYRRKVGKGVQEALKEQFKKYDLTGKTWATLDVLDGRENGRKRRGAGRVALVRLRRPALSATCALVHGHVPVLPGNGRRLGVRDGAAPGHVEATAFAPVSRAQILAGQTAARVSYCRWDWRRFCCWRAG